MRMHRAVLFAYVAMFAAAAPAGAAVDVVPGTDGLTPRGLFAPDRHSVLFSDDCGVVHQIARDRTTTVAGTPSCAETPLLAAPRFGDSTDPLGARLSSMVGLGRGADGEVLLADAGYHRVRSWTSGGVTTLAGAGTQLGDGGFADGPAEVARFDQPANAERLADGTVVVADFGNGRVRAIAGGLVSTLAGGGTLEPADGVRATDARLGLVADVAALPGGDVAFTDATGGKVWRVARDGTLRLVAAGLALPFGLDRRGRDLVVAELRAGRVDRIGADGSVTTLTTAVPMPYAVAVAPCTGDVLVDSFSPADPHVYRLREGAGQGCAFPPGLAARGV